MDLPARFEPGRKYKYSNMISEPVEKVVGYGKFQYINQFNNALKSKKNIKLCVYFLTHRFY